MQPSELLHNTGFDNKFIRDAIVAVWNGDALLDVVALRTSNLLGNDFAFIKQEIQDGLNFLKYKETARMNGKSGISKPYKHGYKLGREQAKRGELVNKTYDAIDNIAWTLANNYYYWERNDKIDFADGFLGGALSYSKKNGVEIMNRQTKNGYTDEIKHSIQLEDKNKMSDYLSSILNRFDIGDVVLIFWRGNSYLWKKVSARGWSRVRENGISRNSASNLYTLGKPLSKIFHGGRVRNSANIFTNLETLLRRLDYRATVTNGKLFVKSNDTRTLQIAFSNAGFRPSLFRTNTTSEYDYYFSLNEREAKGLYNYFIQDKFLTKNGISETDVLDSYESLLESQLQTADIAGNIFTLGELAEIEPEQIEQDLIKHGFENEAIESYLQDELQENLSLQDLSDTEIENVFDVLETENSEFETAPDIAEFETVENPRQMKIALTNFAKQNGINARFVVARNGVVNVSLNRKRNGYKREKNETTTDFLNAIAQVLLIAKPNGAFKEQKYVVVIAPKNSQSKESAKTIDVYAFNSRDALSSAKARLWQVGRNDKQYTFKLLKPNGVFTKTEQEFNSILNDIRYNGTVSRAKFNKLTKLGNSLGWDSLRIQTKINDAQTEFTRNNFAGRRNGAKKNCENNLDAESAANRDDDEYFSDTFDIDNNSKEFQGIASGETFESVASEYAPITHGRIGNLEYIEMLDGERFEFDSNNAFAMLDRRKGIWFSGDVQFDKDEFAQPDTLNIIGQVQRFQYRTTKEHIESGQETSYYHNFGEVDGQLPFLAIDSEGFPLLIGGNYGVKREGVIN